MLLVKAKLKEQQSKTYVIITVNITIIIIVYIIVRFILLQSMPKTIVYFYSNIMFSTFNV